MRIARAEEERRNICVFQFQSNTAAERITDVVRTDDNKLLQESNLATRQPRTAPHHGII